MNIEEVSEQRQTEGDANMAHGININSEEDGGSINRDRGMPRRQAWFFETTTLRSQGYKLPTSCYI